MNEVSPERARQILDVLTQGGSMDHINTPLALNLIPLAQELGEDALVERLIDHASTMASNPIEQGWTRFEALKQMEAPVDGFIRLAEEGEALDGGEAFTAAVHPLVSPALPRRRSTGRSKGDGTTRLAIASDHARPSRDGLRYGVADDHRKTPTR